uniref:Peptidase M1 membrane alanine aminopeptidase domain-containing protein n=1 Tax=Aegilops tauschii subsp. strangulata TaxID=200361 RepID=A0A453MSC0_AEGTS
LFRQCCSYFGTPYALSKLDMIGISNFSWKGMENYGLVTFEIQDLLFNQISSTSTKQHQVWTISHKVILLHYYIIYYSRLKQLMCCYLTDLEVNYII